jgi:hypothetical protein
MSKRNVLVWLVIIILLAIGAVYFWQSAQEEAQEVGQGVPAENIHTSVPTKPAATGSVFENDFIKVTIPEGWRLTEATTTLQDQIYDKNTGKTTKVGKPQTTKNGAVNITKGNYILYINTQALQASGANGGRQAEVTEGVPSADAVITDQPNECGTSDKQPVYEGYFRVDYFMNSQTRQAGCKAPTQGTIWFFSYITDSRNGYFNYYPQGKNGETRALVITMAYNSKDVNKLPVKSDPTLNTTLKEMTSIAQSLQVKK